MAMRKLLLCVGVAATVVAGVAESRTVLQNKGSDTLVNVAQAWAEAYQTVNPDVAIAVSGGGSGTGIAAMINGTVDIANASRRMKAEEIAAAEANGISPVEHVVARDAIAVVGGWDATHVLGIACIVDGIISQSDRRKD